MNNPSTNLQTPIIYIYLSHLFKQVQNTYMYVRVGTLCENIVVLVVAWDGVGLSIISVHVHDFDELCDNCHIDKTAFHHYLHSHVHAH